MNNYKVVGKSLRKIDAVDKTTGRGLFTTDIQLPNMLYAKVLRSPYPHAKIVSIDTTEASKLKGVRAIVTHENTPRNLFNTSIPMFTTTPNLERVLDQYIFDDHVRYVGDEVAAVAADTQDLADQAIKLIKVEYQELPSVFDAYEAMEENAPELHGEKGVTPEGKNIPGEIIRIELGEIEKGLAESDVVVEGTFKLPVQKQVQMETQAAVAQIAGDGKITVWSTTQTPHPSRAILAKIFDIPASKIRVLAPPHMGGAFGVRIGLSAKAEPIAVALAQIAKKPVKLVYDRHEDFIASDTRHPGYVSIKLGAKKDGTFHALDLKGVLSTGAYCSFGAELPGVLGAMTLAIYRIPNQRYFGHGVYTNCTPCGAMRGFGNPQGNLALERTVDNLALKLGMDPLDLRKKNIMQQGDPWCLPYDCGTTELAECIKRGAESISWNNRGKFNNQGHIKRGIGMAVGTHVSNAWPFCVDYDNAYVNVQPDGSVHLACGVPDMGTGTSTSLPQMVAETLGVKFEQVGMTYGDTETTPFDIGSHASRTCYAAGIAVVAATNDVRKQIQDYVAPFFNAKPKDILIEDGIISKTPNPNDPLVELELSKLENIQQGKGNAVTLEHVAYHAHVRNKPFIGLGRTVPPNAPPWHACFADVEVDTQTGEIKVNKMVACHDVGFAINPLIVKGQIHGGVVQGLGYALTEEILYKNDGRQVQDDMHNYMVPTASDIPEMDAIIVEASDPTGPFGAKGAGECSHVCPASALANAVANALDLDIREIPMTPERIFKTLSAA